MTTYTIDIVYYDKNEQPHFSTYRNVCADDPALALKSAIERFHKDHKPFIFDIYKCLLYKNRPLKKVK